MDIKDARNRKRGRCTISETRNVFRLDLNESREALPFLEECNALSILPFCKALADVQDERGRMCLHVIVYDCVFYKVSRRCVFNSHLTFYTFLSGNTGVRQFNMCSNSILVAPVTGFLSQRILETGIYVISFWLLKYMIPDRLLRLYAPGQILHRPVILTLQ